jgi:hypothetical protein
MTGNALRALVLVILLPACGSDAVRIDAGDPPDAQAEPDSGSDAAAPCVTTDPVDLTTASPAEDEDPTLLRAADGRFVLVHFANRGANADLFVTSSADGQIWDPEVRITTDADPDFAPSAIQDASGRYHVAWFHQGPAPGYFRNIRTTSTLDLATWNPADEVDVTPFGVLSDDWVPTLAERPDGDLMIVFASIYRDGVPGGPHDLYATTSSDGAAWSAPSALAAINDPAEHDHLPFLARTDQGMVLTWVRHDDTEATPWLNPSSDVMVATSTDGDAWTAPVNVSHDDAAGALDVFPTAYRRHDGSWSLAWVTTALSPSGSVIDIPLAAVANYPTGAVELPLPGYSPRIVAAEGCQYLGVWVAGPVGTQDIYTRLFAP